jgi:hypothetical protein
MLCWGGRCLRRMDEGSVPNHGNYAKYERTISLVGVD